MYQTSYSESLGVSGGAFLLLCFVFWSPSGYVIFTFSNQGHIPPSSPLCVCWCSLKVVSKLKFSFKLMFWEYSLSSEQTGWRVSLLPSVHAAGAYWLCLREHVWSILLLLAFHRAELWPGMLVWITRAESTYLLRAGTCCAEGKCAVTVSDPKWAPVLLPMRLKAQLPHSVMFNKFKCFFC